MILYINLVIIVSLAIFFYVWFSISPFTAEEIKQFQLVSLNKTSTSVYSTSD